MTQRFLEFVMMQAQNAALFLGQIPNPQTGQAEVNLEVARMFIDQLAMIQEKTRGNLNTEEAKVLRNALGSLQMAFVEASQSGAGSPVPTSPSSSSPSSSSSSSPEPAPEPAAPPSAENAPPTEAAPQAETPEPESKKKFSKSYGS